MLGGSTMQDGKLIAFEGIDGAGLTTQASLLKNWLEDQGYATFLTKEPTNGPIGGLIRLALAKRLKMDPTTLALTFAADRMDHLTNEINPMIKGGVTTILDRYYLSSYAYQSVNNDLKWLMQINSFCIKPDLTILLDVPALTCKKRMERMRWHVELFEETEKLEVVRQNFVSLTNELKEKGERIIIIDGNRPVNSVFKEVKKVITQMLKDTNDL